MHSSSTSNFKSFIFKALLYVFLIILAFAFCLEVKNPLLITSNRSINYSNTCIPDLPKNILVENNNLKFLGENFDDTISREKLCFVGSSRTQSVYVPQEFQWMFQLKFDKSKFWINNCGKDGMSINGWIEVVYSLKSVKPDFVIVLVDPFNQEYSRKEINNSTIRESWHYSILKFIKSLQIFKTIILPSYNISKNAVTQEKPVFHRKVNWLNEEQILTKGELEERIKVDEKSVNLYLKDLISSINSIGAIPILISCPTPFGDYINKNGVDIGLVKGSIKQDRYFHEFSEFVESFCDENNVSFIDGYCMKKGTEFFYDYTHFNIDGSAVFAEKIKPALNLIINK
jgi:hypothetical protein